MTTWYVSTLTSSVGVQPVGLAFDPAGTLYVTSQSTGGHSVQKVAPDGTVTTFAGLPGTGGYADGYGPTARFSSPRGMARDAAGNLYIADAGNNRIRKVTPDGTVTTIAGTGVSGATDGAAMQATFQDLCGLALSPDGTALYVTGQIMQRVRKLDLTTGQVTTIAGSGVAGFANGVGTAAVFSTPTGIALSLDGATLYVADQGNGQIRAIDLATNTVSTYVTGVTSASGVAVHPVTGWVYATGANKVCEIAPAVGGSGPVATIIAGSGGTSSGDGAGTAATFYNPWVLAFDAKGVLYVGEWNWRVRKVTPTGVIVRSSGFASAAGNTATVTIPAGTQLGDHILVRLSHATPSNLITAPQTATCSDPGFVLLDQSSNAAAQVLAEIWTKIAVAGDAGSQVTFTVDPAAATQTLTYLGVYDGASTRLLTKAGSGGLDNGTKSASPPFTYIFTNSGNLALGRPATASSLETTSFPASNAVDGNYSSSTRWSSAYSDPQWIQIDLGLVQPIGKVVLRWENAYGKAYQIQVSDDATNWTTIYSTTTGAGGVETLNVTGTGRYVRMYGTARGTANGYSLYEFEVYPPEPVADINGLAVLLGTADLTSAVSWTGASVPAGTRYRGQVNVTDNSHALGVADGVAPSTAGPKTYNWPTSVATNYLTNVAAVPPPQGSATVPAPVTLRATGYNSTTAPTQVSDTDTGTGTEEASFTQVGWYVTSTAATGIGQAFDIAIDPATGDAYITANSGHKIFKLAANGTLTTFAGSGTAGFKDAAGTAAQFYNPKGIARDAAGNLYVAEESNHRIRKIDPAGNVTTVVGTGTSGWYDGPALQSQISGPNGVAVDDAGNLYITEKGAGRLRRVDSATGQVTTLVSSGLYNPANCRVTPDGSTVYIADQSNGAIRKVDVASKTITPTSWGSCTGPVGVEFNQVTGKIYAASWDSRAVYEINPGTGKAIIVAGTGVSGQANGMGNVAQFYRPVGLATLPDGSMLLADYDANNVRKLTQPVAITGAEAGALSDSPSAAVPEDPATPAAEANPLAMWPETGKFTEAAQVTFQTITPATDQGKGTETQTIGYRSFPAADTGTVTDAGYFADPAQGPASVRFTGRYDTGNVPTSAGNTSTTVTIGPITVNPGELVVLAVGTYNGNSSYSPPSSVTGLGLTWTPISVPGGAFATGSAFRAVNQGDSPVTGSITFGGLSSSTYTWVATYFTGFNPSKPIRSAVASYTLPVTLPAPLNGLSRTVAVFVGSGTTAPTPRPGWAQIAVGRTATPYTAVHWHPTVPDTTATATSPTPNLAIAFEVEAAPFQVADTDDLGAGVDDQGDPVETWPDTGTFTEGAVVAVPKTSTDSGKATDAAVVAIPKTSVDTGVGDEAAIVKDLPLTATEQGTVSESATVQFVRADSGTVTDSAALTVTDSDRGAGTENQIAGDGTYLYLAADDQGVFAGETAVVDITVNAVSDDDPAHGDDTAEVTVATAVADDDAGSLTDDASAAAVNVTPDQLLDAADTATAADGARVGVGDADAGAATDDQPTPQDVSYQAWTAADTGTGTDGAKPALATAAPDDTHLLTLAETQQLKAVDPASSGDSATGTDTAVLVQVSGVADTGSSADTHVDLYEPRKEPADSDTGRFRDRLSILIKDDPDNNRDLTGDDTGDAADDAQVAVTTGDDDWVGYVEAEDAFLANLYLSDDETGWFGEQQQVAVPRADYDDGVVDEAMTVALFSDVSDDRVGVGDAVASLIVVVPGTGDTAAGSDQVAGRRAEAADDDPNTIADTVVYLGIPVTEIRDTDTFRVTELASRAEFSRVVRTGDTGELVDAEDRAVADRFITLTDTASVVDNQYPVGAGVPAVDFVSSVETQHSWDGTNIYYVIEEAGTSRDSITGLSVTAGTDTNPIAENAVARRVWPLLDDWDRAIFGYREVVRLFDGDTLAAVDQAGELAEPRRDLSGSERGRVRDRMSLLLQDLPGVQEGLRYVDDDAVVVDAADTLTAAGGDDDPNTLADAQELFAEVPVGELGAAADAGQLSARPPGADTAVVVIEDAHVAELTSPTVGQESTDTGRSVESRPHIGQAAADAATAGDTATVGPGDTDSVDVADDTLLVAIPVADTATGGDNDPLIGQTHHDTGSVDEPAAHITVTVADLATAGDGGELSVAVPAAENGAFTEQVESSVALPDGDSAGHTDAEHLFADTSDPDGGALTDTQTAHARTSGGDVATPVEGGGVLAAADGTDHGRVAEAALLYSDSGIGAFTGDDARVGEDHTVTAGLPADDGGAGSETGQPFVDTRDGDDALVAAAQTLTVDVSSADTGRVADAALLHTETGTGAFTGDDARIGETARLATWEAFAYPADDEPATVTETQSVYRRNPDQPWIELRPSSLLKVNVVTKQVALSNYRVADEYPIAYPLPDAARFKLAAFGAVLTPHAEVGDELEDADFRYRYQARWLTPNRRETGWYIVAWRRDPHVPTDWLA